MWRGVDLRGGGGAGDVQELRKDGVDSRILKKAGSWRNRENYATLHIPPHIFRDQKSAKEATKIGWEPVLMGTGIVRCNPSPCPPSPLH